MFYLLRVNFLNKSIKVQVLVTICCLMFAIIHYLMFVMIHYLMLALPFLLPDSILHLIHVSAM